MDEITIFNWVHLAGLIIILSFLAKHYHDTRKGYKLLLQEMRGTRNEMQGIRIEMQGVRNEMQGVHKEIHESESGLIGKLHESERRLSKEIREVTAQLSNMNTS